MLDKTSSIICAFGLASAAPRSPYRHLELCGIALTIFFENNYIPLVDKPAGFVYNHTVANQTVLIQTINNQTNWKVR
jgi:hypothetical protein